jgi:hypothetical protein
MNERFDPLDVYGIVPTLLMYIVCGIAIWAGPMGSLHADLICSLNSPRIEAGIGWATLFHWPMIALGAVQGALIFVAIFVLGGSPAGGTETRHATAIVIALAASIGVGLFQSWAVTQDWWGWLRHGTRFRTPYLRYTSGALLGAVAMPLVCWLATFFFWLRYRQE